MKRENTSIRLSRREVSLLKSLAKESNLSQSRYILKCLMEQGRATTPLLTGEELAERIEILEKIEQDNIQRAVAKSTNIRLGNERYWNEKTGMDTEERRQQQKARRREYQRKWMQRKREQYSSDVE